jgi:TRAP-type uncharacterized transport system fused permease subunit
VSRIEPSHFDSATFYVTFDNHRNDDYTPYVFVTTNFGRTFTSIVNNLPQGQTDFVHVIREDTKNQNLLFVGTDVGAYVAGSLFGRHKLSPLISPKKTWEGLAGGIAVALLTIWQVFRPLAQGSQFYLIVFLAGTLPLVFLVYRPGWGRIDPPNRPGAADWALAAVTLVVCLYPVAPVWIGAGGYDDFLDRQGLLDPTDVAMGAALLVLILEACRRTTGWALPIVCGLFLAYGYYGGLLPQGWAIAHAGLNFDQIIDALYNSGSGFFGTPLDVAATYIVLFTIYGAVLELSGAARFFVDLSVATFRRSPSAAGRSPAKTSTSVTS